MGKRTKFWVLSLFGLIISCGSIYFLTNVNSELTTADIEAIQSLELDAFCKNTSSFESEIKCLQNLQKVLFNRIPTTTSPNLAEEAEHEPATILKEKWGSCYDRSRIIEKTLNYYQMKTRHVSAHHLLKPNPIGYFFAAPSHAFTEVLTKNGWLIVGSSSLFIGLKENGELIDTEKWREELRNGESSLAFTAEHHPALSKGKFNYIYGLYSRHGMFYPPFVRLPDIDWSQIKYNF